MKNVQGTYSKVKVNGFRQECMVKVKKNNFTSRRRNLQRNDMIFCKHDTLLSCFFFQIQTSNFRRRKKISFNGLGRSL